MRPALLLIALLALPLAPQAAAPGGELRGRWDTDPQTNQIALQAKLHGDLNHGPWAVHGATLLESIHPKDASPAQQSARVLELNASADLGPWQLAGGRKVVSWDVGWAWRPNDVVQQEQRRQLGPVSLVGRPLLMAEHFEGETATSLVWVNPNRHGETDARSADESALALRHYRREGALDLHLHARWGEHTQGSLGLAAAWVGDASLELHGSVRRLNHFDLPGALPGDLPGPVADGGAATLALAGLTWTGAQQQTLILEAWWDGTAPPAKSPLIPFSQGQQRRNVYGRGTWQPDAAPAWTLSLDMLYHPEDRGWQAGTGAVWQADRLSVEAALRWSDGPADSVAAHLPVRRNGVLALRWPF
jgi:hypothetical protein